MITYKELTLTTSRKKLFEEMEGLGGICPCCDRFAKFYKRPINRTMVSGLYWIIDAPKDVDGYVSVAETGPVWLLRSNQHTVLKHWGLVEQAVNTDPSLNDSGRWRPTELGLQFANEKKRIKRYALLFNDNCFELMGELVFAKHIVDRFNYAQIMTGVFHE